MEACLEGDLGLGELASEWIEYIAIHSEFPREHWEDALSILA
jgi:hypothetical protein